MQQIPVPFDKDAKKEFDEFRNGTASILKTAVMDLEPKEVNGQWFVGEENSDYIHCGPMANEQDCWDWIRSIRIVE